MLFHGYDIFCWIYKAVFFRSINKAVMVTVDSLAAQEPK